MDGKITAQQCINHNMIHIGYITVITCRVGPLQFQICEGAASSWLSMWVYLLANTALLLRDTAAENRFMW